MTLVSSFAPGPFARRALLLPALFSGLLLADAFALGGTVRTSAGAPLAGAVVSLVSDTSMRRTTDSTGSFSLGPTNIASGPGASAAAGRNLSRLSLRDGRVRFALRSPVREAALEIFTGDGVRRFEATLGPLRSGAHEVAVPALETRAHYLRVSLDGGSVVKPMQARTEAPAQARTQTRSAAAAIDTLLVRKAGFLTVRSPIESYARADLAIVLHPDTVSPLPAITDYAANGPFATVVETNVGPDNAYTIIRPESLGVGGFLHAPIIYGHGINAQVSGFTPFLRNVASHGFVIIARNVLTGGPNNAANTAAMNDGLNWILRQDTTIGSKYRGKLATDRAAAMGYSVGGTAAVDIGGHPALRTVVSIHGHISTAVQRGPLLQTSGTLDNVGLPMQQQTFSNSTVQTFLGTVTGANHGYIQSNNGGVQRPAIVAWLRYWIYNDQGAKRYFYGSDCVMCVAPWENPQRKNWN